MFSVLVRSFVPRAASPHRAVLPPVTRPRGGFRLHWERDSTGRLTAHWARP